MESRESSNMSRINVGQRELGSVAAPIDDSPIKIAVQPSNLLAIPAPRSVHPVCWCSK